MTQETTVRKLVNFILRDVELINLPGLFQGKAGLSLSLFIASKFLQDETFEDIAYELLKKSLVINYFDTSFETGLSGIGYVLLYLIENNYLDADFDEIFGEQYQMIIKGFETIEKDPMRLINSLQVIYFLSKVKSIKKEDERIRKIIQKIFEGLELFLIVHFQDFTDIHYINNKEKVLNIYKMYLQLVDYSGYNYFSKSVLEDFAALYRRGRIVSSIETGFYLRNITTKHDISIYDDVVAENISNGINNIYVDTLSLKERIDLAKIINIIKPKNDKKYDRLLYFENLRKGKEIEDLLKTIDEKSYPLGYGAGLSRFLIYYVNQHIELL